MKLTIRIGVETVRISLEGSAWLISTPAVYSAVASPPAAAPQAGPSTSATIAIAR